MGCLLEVVYLDERDNNNNIILHKHSARHMISNLQNFFLTSRPFYYHSSLHQKAKMKLSCSSLLIPKPFLLPSLALALFAVQLGLSLAEPTFSHLLRDILCKQHYKSPADKLLPGAQCDVEPVRRELEVLLEGIFISTTVAGKPPSPPLSTIP